MLMMSTFRTRVISSRRQGFSEFSWAIDYIWLNCNYLFYFLHHLGNLYFKYKCEPQNCVNYLTAFDKCLFHFIINRFAENAYQVSISVHVVHVLIYLTFSRKFSSIIYTLILIFCLLTILENYVFPNT